MLNKTVTVYTVDGERRSSIDLTIGLGNDIDRVEQVIRDALADLDSINRVGSIRARGLTVGAELGTTKLRRTKTGEVGIAHVPAGEVLRCPHSCRTAEIAHNPGPLDAAATTFVVG